MRISNLWLALLLLAFAFGCKDTKKEVEKDTMEEEISVEEEVNVEKVSFTMEAKSGSEVSGKVTFEESEGKVKMMAELSGLTPGEHAIHLHEKGSHGLPDHFLLASEIFIDRSFADSGFPGNVDHLDIGDAHPGENPECGLQDLLLLVFLIYNDGRHGWGLK